jgi:DEAD/DEAH box helicase domain-containing protein
MRAGKNVVITSPTAFGKTLAFNVPIFERIDHERSATLSLNPTKALSNDQLRMLEEFELIAGIPVIARVYDCDTPSHKRPKM